MKRKTIAALALMTVLAMCLTGCKKDGASASADESAPAATGGWELSGQTETVLPDTVKEAFDQAMAGRDDIIPVAFVGEQAVAGKNYMLLCAETSGGSTTGYKMIVIYRDLQGNSTLAGESPFELANYVGGSAQPSGETLSGGWAAPDEATKQPLAEEAQTAFDKAAEGFIGSEIEPMALLGTQVVAGMNYAMLCRVTPVSPQAIPSIQVVTVYADLQQGAQFTGFCAVEQADFNK